MASKHVTWAIAHDSEISALGCSSIGEAVSVYSDAAANNFRACRFVPLCLVDSVNGVADDDYVLVVTGLTELQATIGRFKDEPPDLRGYILFSNCDYFVGELNITFGKRGGNAIPVDQFLCGADGKPALCEEIWQFVDYFNDQEQICVNGQVYVKAWDVVRVALPFKQQNVASIVSINYLADYPHALPDGSAMCVAKKPRVDKTVVLSDKFQQLYTTVGVPFIGNGDSIRSVLKNPVFLHAFVKCLCGHGHWTVGDWSGYKSLCCGVKCKPLLKAAAITDVGNVVVTRANLGRGIKYYANMFLQHICDVDGLACWHLVKVQAADGFVLSGDFQYVEDCTLDACNYLNNDDVAMDLKFSILTGEFSDLSKDAVIKGYVSVSSSLVDLTDDILGTPWFVKKLGELAGAAWNSFKSAVRALCLASAEVIALARSLSCAAVRVLKGSLTIVADVPAKFLHLVQCFCTSVNELFLATTDMLVCGGQKFCKFLDFVLLDNAIVKLVTSRVKGPKQAGVGRVLYTAPVVGGVTVVRSTRTELCDATLVLVEGDVPVATTGVTMVIGGVAFFKSGEYYRFMSASSEVLNQPVFAELQEPTFECPVIQGFPVLKDADVASLCVKVDSLLQQFNNSFCIYSTIIRKGRCCITAEYSFVPPPYIKDGEGFVESCKQSVAIDSFADFYAKAHVLSTAASFVKECCGMDGFSHFTKFVEVVDCPTVLLQLDGGVLWNTFATGVNAISDFCASLKLSLEVRLVGAHSALTVVATASKRFKKLCVMLVNLYNDYLNTVCSFVKIAGVSVLHYATTVPCVIFGSFMSTVRPILVTDLDVSHQDGIDNFLGFDAVTTSVTPLSVEEEVVELQEIDFCDVPSVGRIVVINGYSFYTDGTCYYPSNGRAVATHCFVKRGGRPVVFSEEVDVKTIDPTHKVRMEYEFEDENITTVLHKVLGHKIEVVGYWQNLVEIVDAAMGVLRQHINVPAYYIYDEQGGEDLNLTVMVSQWPIVDAEHSDGNAIDGIATIDDEVIEVEQVPLEVKLSEVNETTPVDVSYDEVTEVEQALSFIEVKPTETVVDNFAFPFVSYDGLKVFQQNYNNCWVTSILVQLQLLDVYHSDAFDLFNVGRVSPMVRKCYETQGAVLGSLGDVAQGLQILLKDLNTLKVSCTTVCDCGAGDREYLGCVFRMTPVGDSFAYGVCPQCSQVLLHTIVGIEGTGVFCRDPNPITVDSLLVKPISASAYIGDVNCGHYVTNVYQQDVAVDGNGVHDIKYDTLDTICVKDVNWKAHRQDKQNVLKPFATYLNIEFYQGEFDSLVSVDHDFVVNAANENLAHGGGIAKAIDVYTGGELQRVSTSHINAHGKLKVGQGVMLDVGGKKIFNVVGPRKGKHADTLLQKAYSSVFAEKGVPLMPLLSVGIFKVPIDLSLQSLVSVAGERVVKCFCYGNDEVEIINGVLQSLQQQSAQPVIESISDVAPFVIYNGVSFFELSNSVFKCSGADKVVFFTDSTLKFCQAAFHFDTFVSGALSTAVAKHKKLMPTTPAGNCLAFRCCSFVEVVFVVLPSIVDVTESKGFNRAIHKCAKLKGKLLVCLNDCLIFSRVATMNLVGCVATHEFAEQLQKPVTVVLPVTEDLRSTKFVQLDTAKSFGDQIGCCVKDAKVVTENNPSVVDNVVTVPNIDWVEHYGFENAECFKALDHKPYDCESSVQLNRRVLKTTDNNCWVNATCLQLQSVQAKFKSQGLQAMWESFCAGAVAEFVHWLYWVTAVERGQPSDTENTLNLIAKYVVSSGSATVERKTASGCCVSARTINSVVVNASVVKTGHEDGYCKHGEQYIHRLVGVKGRVIICNIGGPMLVDESTLINGVTYTGFTDSTLGVGHYTVYDNVSGSVHDGDRVLPGNLSLHPVTNVVVNVTKPVIFRDPVDVVERHYGEIIFDHVNVASKKFFTFGDFVSRNLILFIVYVFSTLVLFLKAFKKKDLAVLAGVPERTGIILKRSLRYNIASLVPFFKAKIKYFSLFCKLSFGLYALYALLFMLIRFTPFGTPLCNGYIEGYANSTFVKNEFCDSVLCKICLHGYQELPDFLHTKVVWQHFREPLFINLLPLAYLVFLGLFGGFYVKCFILYFVAQYVNMFFSYVGLQQSIYLLQVFPFSVFGDEIVVLFIVFKVLVFCYHALFGCDKPSCVACSKSARLKRVPISTVIQGTTKSLYVHANGGSSFCAKHNFFCLNCESYGPGNTFINDMIAPEVANVTKLDVRATGPAVIEIDKVEFSNGFYYIYSGDTFWKYNFDITKSEYCCKDVLKTLTILSDFIVYNSTGSNVSQIRNACVYFSQLLCKPIKLVNSELLTSLSVNFEASLHSAFVDVLTTSFGKDLSKCTNLRECKVALGLDDVSDSDFSEAVAEAHHNDVLLSDLSFNNLCTTYCKPEEKFPVSDIATCMRVGAKIANHNLLVKDTIPVVWFARDFLALSEDTRKYIVRTSKTKGLTFLLTFNNVRMHTTIPLTCFANKKGAGCHNFGFWWCCIFTVLVFWLLPFVNFSDTIASADGYAFKHITHGVLYEFDEPLDCVHNVFNNFEDWHYNKFGVVPLNKPNCPIVVGVLEESRVVPGLASNVYLFGKTLVFSIKSVFSFAGLCFDQHGVADRDACVFNSLCTVLDGFGGLSTYCYEAGLVDGAKSYSDLLPNTVYRLLDGNKINLPETISRGLGFKTIKTKAQTYCRVGQCIDSREGVCFGVDRFFVYSSDVGDGFVCGTGLFSLLYNVVSIFQQSMPVVVLSGQIMFNCVIAFLSVVVCFLFTKFKRMFGDMSYGVFVVVACTFVNNLSYFLTQNFLGLVFYVITYFLATKGVKYVWVWHIGFVAAYSLLAPWWVLLVYVISAVVEFLPNIFKLKVSTQLFDGGKFVGTFESAACGTFVLDMHSYERLANSITPDKLKQYAQQYNKYKYYTGSATESDYRLACFSHLAVAMMNYATSHNDMLYTPPTVNFNSTLQSGLRKMAQPTGVIEKCVVRVAYGNMVLNGVWLGDVVVCPRHVLAKDTNNTIDYDHALATMRLHNFSISFGNNFLGVVGATMRGALLHIKVNQNNVHTPRYVYRTIRAGENFNILACYDGVPSGVFGVNMRTNYTIRGSFINGACGSVGFNIVNGTVEFCYVHQLELGSGCHVGSDFDGVMYGGYVDQPTLQVEGTSQLVTENVVAFLYGALLNGCNWWLKNDLLSLSAFNDWAVSNGFTTINSVDNFAILAAKTGVDVMRILASIQDLYKSFGGKNILGFTSLTDEFTMAEVVQQMYGVKLQGGKTTRAVRNCCLVGLLLSLFWSEFVAYTKFVWINPGYITPVFLLLALFSLCLMLTVKHKLVFLQVFLLPALAIVSCVNLSWDYHIYDFMSKHLDYHVSMMGLNAQGFVNIFICGVLFCLNVYRFCTVPSGRMLCLCGVVMAVYGVLFPHDVLNVIVNLLSSVTGHWVIGATAYRVACYIVVVAPYVTTVFGPIKGVVLVYLIIGYFTCCFYGILYWFNRFFKATFGVYDYKVSAAEFKFMVANGLRAPSTALDAMILSAQLVGIGGEKTIKISTVQSKLTDVKCANVVLLGCLAAMNITANSAEWAYCVDLHNKINLCNDAEHAQEMLLALIAFFLSKNSAFGVEDLVDSYLGDNAILQSVASTFVGLPSFVSYETARQAYEDAVASSASPQLIKQLRTAMNCAKSEFDREVATQRKLDRMAEQAAAQMFKDARAVNRKSKITSAMHSLLFGMLRKLDMSSVDTILSLAKNGTVPLAIIPAASATKLTIVSADFESYQRIHKDGCVHYAGAIWSVIDVKDNDGKVVHVKEVNAANVESLAWPLVLNCERVVKLQNNEIMPGKLKQRVVKAEGDGVQADGKALYNSESGKTFMYAFIADKPDLRFVKWECDGGVNLIELEPPRKFLVDNVDGPLVKYLYFVKNLNTLRRGAVLGYIGATIRLQAGKQTELAVNSALLTMCSFSTEPAQTYIKAVKNGLKPVSNCIKMLANGSGNGQAITNGVEANVSQDSYGGASVCLFCRAHVEHPDMDGYCKLKGKYVQVPLGCADPIRFVLENTVCGACGCWLGYGCSCDRTVIQSLDTAYLNECGALVQLD